MHENHPMDGPEISLAEVSRLIRMRLYEEALQLLENTSAAATKDESNLCRECRH